MGVGRLKGQISLKSIKVVEKADSEPLGWRTFAFQASGVFGVFFVSLTTAPTPRQVVYMENEERNVLYIIASSEQQREEWLQTITCGLIASYLHSFTHPLYSLFASSLTHFIPCSLLHSLTFTYNSTINK